MEPCLAEHSIFEAKTFCGNNESIFVIQALISPPVYIHRNNGVPRRNAIKSAGYKNIREATSAPKKETPEKEPAVRTPVNNKRESEVLLVSPQQSAAKRRSALRHFNFIFTEYPTRI
jgi:hypothetical protein